MAGARQAGPVDVGPVVASNAPDDDVRVANQGGMKTSDEAYAGSIARFGDPRSPSGEFVTVEEDVYEVRPLPGGEVTSKFLKFHKGQVVSKEAYAEATKSGSASAQTTQQKQAAGGKAPENKAAGRGESK